MHVVKHLGYDVFNLVIPGLFYGKVFHSEHLLEEDKAQKDRGINDLSHQKVKKEKLLEQLKCKNCDFYRYSLFRIHKSGESSRRLCLDLGYVDKKTALE